MTLGPVRVMGIGMVVMMYAEQVIMIISIATLHIMQ